jgi:branched-chain amino acid transport system substrate-binding protein
MVKKLLAIFVAAVLVAGLVACTGSGTPAVSPPVKEDAPSPAQNSPVSNAPDSPPPSAQAPTAPFRISTYLQLSGNNAETGNNAKMGIDLAFKLVNENGGFNGATVEVTHYDTTGSTEEAVKIVQKVLESKSADAIIGSVNSNEVSAVIPYINEAKLYNFGLGTSATWMADESMIWTFRASANNGRLAPLGAQQVLDLGFKSVGIISGTDDTGRSTADAFEATCAKLGITVTGREECDSNDTDFAGQIAKLMAGKPDTIYMSLIGSTFGPFTKQVRNMGYNGILTSKDPFSLSYIAGAGEENSDYVAFIYPYVTYEKIADCEIPAMKDFLERFYAEYGKMPTHEAAYRGWDTVMAMWEASKIAGANDSESLRAATHKVSIPGLGGTLDYTKGDREGYSAFNSFILVKGKNILLDEWLASGGMDAYKAATGR